MIVEIFASTDVGRNYQHNEDNFAICRDLYLKEWLFKSREEQLSPTKVLYYWWQTEWEAPMPGR
jgi:hypothetical protein